MSLMNIRGQQIKDYQIEDRHIKGKLSESVLNIDFQSHAGEIFDTKVIVDMVQKGPLSVSLGAAQFTFTTDVAASAGPGVKGVVLNNYRVKIRNEATGEPILYSNTSLGADGLEIFGVITTGVDASGGSGTSYLYTVELKAEKPDGTIINASLDEAYNVDIVYPRRFSFKDVDEAFAANERFVDGAADITAHLNIRQLAEEVFGDTYNLNNLGDLSDPFGNGNSLVEEITRLTTGVVNTGESASGIIDEIVTARGGNDSLNLRLSEIINNASEAVETLRTNLATSGTGKGAEMIMANDTGDAVNGLFGVEATNVTVQGVLDSLFNKVVDDIAQHKTDLASTAVGKGASLVSISDQGNNFTATHVEGALSELFDKIVADMTTESEARIEADNALSTRAEALETEMTTARGTAESLDERLDVSLHNDGSIKEFTRFHKHHYYTKAINADGTTSVVFTFPGVNQFDIPKSSDFYKVNVNGLLQKSNSSVYTITVSMNDVTIEFATPLFNEDVIGLEATIHGVSQI